MTTILNKAMGFEEKSVSFYSKIENEEKDSDLKSLFKRLSEEEKKHKEIITRFGLAMLGNKWNLDSLS